MSAASPAPARVALVGASGHGRWHLDSIAQLQADGVVELVAVADVAPVPDPPAGVPIFEQVTEMLAAVGPDIVVVCTPPHTHLAIATTVLEYGADLLLEKPPVLDSEQHRRLTEVVTVTGRACQIGFQALASPALSELLAAIDNGLLGELRSVSVAGAWKRDEKYFHRGNWVGRARVDGQPVLDGALANPFAHAVMQVLAIVRQPLSSIEVERYRTRDIQVDDTASLRLGFVDGTTALVAVTLCAEEFVAGEIVVTGTAGTATLEYPTDQLRLPGDEALRLVPGRPSLLANLAAHRADPTVKLLAPLARTAPFTEVLDVVTTTPVTAIDDKYLTTAVDLPDPRLVITGVNEVVRQAASSLALFSEVAAPWATANS